jgi:hypothetical protein
MKKISLLALLAVVLSACGGGGSGAPAGSSFTVGGTVTGLAGSGLVLQDNGSDDLAISADGAFTFATAVADSAAYAVTVKTQPAGQTCTANNGNGMMAGANVSGVAVTCSANAYTVGGTASGLTAAGLVLQNNNADDLTISANGAFSFATKVADGASYAVTIKTQPVVQTCTVNNGSGTMAGANVSGVSVACTTRQLGGARQGAPLNLIGAVTTLAGTPFSKDATGAVANFNFPAHMVRVGGSLFVADTSSHTIRQIVIATGAVTTLAGSPGMFGSTDDIGAAARFSAPNGITSDGTNLYVADTHSQTIRKIVIASGAVTTLAGSPGLIGSTDATGAAARFNFPNGITTDGTNVYVADSNNQTIRKVVIASGVVTTLAGTALTPGSIDGTGAAARFKYPQGITINGVNLYVADTINGTIRQIVIASGAVTTLAGTAGPAGSVDGIGAAARFNSPYGIVSDGTSLYLTDQSNYTLRKIVIATGAVTTLAGTAGSLGSTDGTGAAARFNFPYGIATDNTNLYVTDQFSNTIRQVVIASGAVTTLASTAVGVDGTGPAARFSQTAQITSDGTNLYVLDSNTIRQVVIANGAVTTLAGTAGTFGSVDGIGAAARFNGPQGITTDGINLYVVDSGNNTIRQVVIATGAVTTLAGTTGPGGSSDGTGPAARFKQATQITTDGSNLYVVDNGNHTIRKIAPASGSLSAMTSANAVVTTLAGTAGTFGSTDGIGAAALFHNPSGITSDGSNLYVLDNVNHTIRKIAPASGSLSDMTSANAVVTTLAGTAGTTGSVDGTGGAALFNIFYGITSDGSSLYVADNVNQTIRKIVPASGSLSAMTSANAVVTTLAGSAGSLGTVDAIGASARFFGPSGITSDGTRLLIGDYRNGTVRVMQ